MSVLTLGIDVGTSGCRALVLRAADSPSASAEIIAETQQAIPAPIPYRVNEQIIGYEQAPEIWWQALCQCVVQLAQQTDLSQLSRLALDATSGTLLLADKSGNPLSPALMYNDARATREASHIKAYAPVETAAQGATSALAKALWLVENTCCDNEYIFLHQADWLVGKLTGLWGISDTNNCMKLGFDAEQHQWPAWLSHTGLALDALPRVYSPGEPVAPVTDEALATLGLPASLTGKLTLCAGTTDSTAAIYATGISQPGDAVTCLGSTLVMKVLHEKPIFAPEFGVYSQPFADRWLVGGGSNSGGSVLRHFFSDQQMRQLEQQLRPHTTTGLDYYPLLSAGERFPINDAGLQPRLTPRPDDDAIFFQALLEGMATIEKASYDKLAELGAPYPQKVVSIGGGAKNLAWQQIRSQKLGVTVIQSAHQQAAYGAALLALQADNT